MGDSPLILDLSSRHRQSATHERRSVVAEFAVRPPGPARKPPLGKLTEHGANGKVKLAEQADLDASVQSCWIWRFGVT